MIKRIVLVRGSLILLVVLIPFLGPYVGLADYQSAAPRPGLLITLPNGDQINVYREGSGPPVVLIHGLPGTGSMMLPLARALVEHGYSTVSYDRIGWGYSSQRSEKIAANPTENARDFLRLLETLELQNPLVIGYSYGGGVALEAARLDPNAFSNLVLVASLGDNARRCDPPGRMERLLFSPSVLRWFLGTDFIATRLSEAGVATMFAPEAPDPAFLRETLASMALPGVPETMVRERMERYQGFAGYQPEATSACTLIIHGIDDQIVSASGAEALSNAISGSELRLLSDTGHAVVMTQPERLADMISVHDRKCAS